MRIRGREAAIAVPLVLAFGLTCRSAVPVTEGFAVTDDSVRIYYRVIGRGPETVLAPVASLHGSSLDRLSRGRRIVLYDNRGRARSDSVPHQKISLDHQFRDLEAVRRAVGAERFALIGWSGLGMELFVYTLRHPERVTRLVQLAPVPPRWEPYSRLMMEDRNARTDSVAAAGVEARNAAGAFASEAEYCRERARVTLPATFADPASATLAPDLCTFRNEWPSRLGPYFDALLASFAGFDFRPDLDRVSVPRLVIHGERDNISLEGNVEWVAGRAGARLVIVPNAGHWPHYEQPDVTLAAIHRFLKGGWPDEARSIP